MLRSPLLFPRLDTTGTVARHDAPARPHASGEASAPTPLATYHASGANATTICNAPAKLNCNGSKPALVRRVRHQPTNQVIRQQVRPQSPSAPSPASGHAKCPSASSPSTPAGPTPRTNASGTTTPRPPPEKRPASSSVVATTSTRVREPGRRTRTRNSRTARTPAGGVGRLVHPFRPRGLAHVHDVVLAAQTPALAEVGTAALVQATDHVGAPSPHQGQLPIGAK